ncbi:MAG: Phage portal protein, partial [Dehalococcoidia bacterium]|nr:Phage portal protein [Dehalococcoidia bacterium]
MIDAMQRTASRLSPTGSGPLPQQLTRMDISRLRAYRENLEFYQGIQWQEPRRRRERRLTFNYAKTVVEKTASYVVSGYSSLVDP